MQFNKTLLPLAAAAMVAFSGVAMAQDRGAVLTNSCWSCHGPDGNSATAIPAIGGKDAAFIKDQLMGFKSGDIESTVMDRIAKGYTDEEIAIIANAIGKK